MKTTYTKPETKIVLMHLEGIVCGTGPQNGGIGSGAGSDQEQGGTAETNRYRTNLWDD